MIDMKIYLKRLLGLNESINRKIIAPDRAGTLFRYNI